MAEKLSDFDMFSLLAISAAIALSVDSYIVNSIEDPLLVMGTMPVRAFLFVGIGSVIFYSTRKILLWRRN